MTSTNTPANVDLSYAAYVAECDRKGMGCRPTADGWQGWTANKISWFWGPTAADHFNATGTVPAGPPEFG